MTFLGFNGDRKGPDNEIDLPNSSLAKSEVLVNYKVAGVLTLEDRRTFF